MMRNAIRHIAFKILYYLPLFLLLSCSSPTRHSPGKNPAAQRDTATYSLPLPVPPKSMTTPEERSEFMAANFWNAMDWNDTLLLASERFMGESIANFGFMLSLIAPEKASAAISTAAKAASVNRTALNTLSAYAGKYFYYPDSPQYDAELYLLFIDALMSQPALREEERLRLEERRADILKNRVGTIATDFSYIGEDGRSHTLSATATAANIRILFLYDPDCDACEEAVGILKSSPAFTRSQDDGETAIIAINAYGQKNGGPAHRKSSFPALWTVGYSPAGEIDEDEIYAIRATPAIYILDSAGTILEKDLSLPRLSQIING